jgi:hypothetical protein
MKTLPPVVLALVSWLLLTPPYARNGNFNSSAPLADWTDAAEFPSHAECEDYRHHVKPEDLARNGQKGVINEAAEAKLRMRGQCVSSDDPRLQRN